MEAPSPARVVVTIRWDGDGQTWCAWSDQVPGLALEHTDYDEIVALALEITPELVAANAPDLKGLPLHIAAFSSLAKTR